MSVTLELQNDTIYLPRVGGELNKSELNAAQAEFGQKFAAAGSDGLLVLLESFTGWERGSKCADTPVIFSRNRRVKARTRLAE